MLQSQICRSIDVTPLPFFLELELKAFIFHCNNNVTLKKNYQSFIVSQSMLFKVQVIERVVPNTPHMLLQREHWWIRKLQTKKPHGLNDLD